ncbi:hypothetical protein ACFFF5_17540 [Lederbergia wuyishanensis]|uniref:Uncharacterized protein n=1 Tax=Lederbergia wuyishanensis TaxID=1347903 RepID=A0ABU0DAK3_9BACI|nr:hypothetical protein [Lederbergia wuyishanensis]MCJ8009684.1 hypothetical protein [Lederbergia wuyishanensis]MDQ0345441.1 hypothetical protein [Lederbergia wuyishanensis]
MPSNIGTGISKPLTIEGTGSFSCSTPTSTDHSNPPMMHAIPAKRMLLAVFGSLTLLTIIITPSF